MTQAAMTARTMMSNCSPGLRCEKESVVAAAAWGGCVACIPCGCGGAARRPDPHWGQKAAMREIIRPQSGQGKSLDCAVGGW